MHLCSNNHDEVAFAGSWANDCPACTYANEIKEEMQQEIDELKERLDE